MKQCFKCLETKDRSEFYAHPQMGDGLLGKCKACTRKDAEDRRKLKEATDPDWVRKEAIRQREKERRRKNRPKTNYSATLANRQKFPEKYKARSVAQRVKPAVHGNQLHHWSYKPEHRKDVIELTAREHGKAHRFLIYDQEHFQYRRCDTMELLDTRERHEAFIRSMIETQED